MFPSGEGGMAFLQYAYQDQDRNWSGTSPSARRRTNDDKEIQTHFLTFGRSIYVQSELGCPSGTPLRFSLFQGQGRRGRTWYPETGASLATFESRGIYTGLFADMSAGLTLGLKLPTGDYTFDSDVVDRDSRAWHRQHRPPAGWLLSAQLDWPGPSGVVCAMGTGCAHG